MMRGAIYIAGALIALALSQAVSAECSGALQNGQALADLCNKAQALSNIGAIPLSGGSLTGNLALSTFSQTSSAEAGLNLSTNAYSINLSVTAATSSGFGAYPMSLIYVNESPNFRSPYAGNYQQFTPLKSRGLDSPTSTGNTGAAVFEMDSYGNNPSSAYDIPITANGAKYGQNSMWGIVTNLDDFSGRPPQAFAAWNMEQDIDANGPDIPPWDPNSNKAAAGSRVFNYMALGALDLSGSTIAHGGWTWAARTAVTAMGVNATDFFGASIVKVTVSSVPYLWYCLTSGTTGRTVPSYPSPSEFVATIAHGEMTVTSVVTGSNTLAANAYVSSQTFITPLEITSQLSGTPGGVGTYAVSNSGVTISVPTGMYAAPHVTDGSAVWAFGENFAMSVSVGDWFTGSNLNTSLNTEIGGNVSISNAVLDTSQNNILSGGAAIRMAAGQTIDFTGNGTAVGNNRHRLFYATYQSADILAYQANGLTEFSIADNGNGAFAGGLSFGGHQVSTQATAPTVVQYGGIGSSTLNAQATDAKGTVTEGAGATGFVLNFNAAYATAPDCVVTSPTGSAFTSYTPATGTLTVVHGALTAAKFTYHCIQ
jgi:hypothetical protein